MQEDVESLLVVLNPVESLLVVSKSVESLLADEITVESLLEPSTPPQCSTSAHLSAMKPTKLACRIFIVKCRAGGVQL